MFAGSPHETRRCPRKQIDQTTGTILASELYWHTDGRLGPAVLQTFSPPLVEAIGLIASGNAWQQKQEVDRMKRQADTRTTADGAKRPHSKNRR